MSKEINEQQTTSTKTCIKEYLDRSLNEKILTIYNFPINPKEINKITLIGCGTAYHSCLMAKYLIRRILHRL